MAIIVGEVVAPIRGDSRGFRREISNVRSLGNTAFSKMGSGVTSFGNLVEGVGKKITQYITVPLLGAAAASFKLGKDFEGEMSKVVGLVGVAKEQVDSWGKDILELAPKLGKSPQKLGEALFFVTSAGIRGAAAMDVLRDSGKASAAGLGETATIADLVTSAMNAYGQENLSSAKATDILVAAVREGKAEASELASSMGQVLPLASELSVSFDQVAATQAAMTKTGTSASEAATQLKSIMAGLVKPAKQAEEQLKNMGTSSAEMRKKIRDDGLLSALMDLREMTNKYGEEAMARVFPNIRALMGVLDLMGSNLEGNVKTFDAVKNSTGSLDKAFQSASETVDFKWNSAISKIQSVLIKFFDIIKVAMIPALEGFVKILDFVSKKFEGMSPGIQQVILILGGMAGLIGPSLMAVGTIIGALGGVITLVAAAVGGLATIISTVGIPILLYIGAAIGGLILAFISLALQIGTAIGLIIGSFIHLWNTNTEFRNNAINTWNSIKKNAMEIFTEIKRIITRVMEYIKILWEAHGSTIMSIAKTVWTDVFMVVKSSMMLIKNIVKLISAMLHGDWSKAWSAVKGIVKSGAAFVISSVKLMGDILYGSVGTITKHLVNQMKSGFSAIKKINWKSVGISIVKSIILGIASMVGKLASQVNKVAKTIRDRLPFSPAKEGPLKDLDKLNFGGPINDSLRKARLLLEPQMNALGGALLTENGFSGSTSNKSQAYSFYGDININGVQDVEGFMEEIRRTVLRHGGRNSF